jgi:hypothetical protein
MQMLYSSEAKSVAGFLGILLMVLLAVGEVDVSLGPRVQQTSLTKY